MDKWNNWYKDINVEDIGSFRYGDTITYELGYNFLKDCNKIEDWGCGIGGFKRFIKTEDNIEYVGVDGSITPFANIKAYLTTYNSNTDGIFMRHILEHNYEWKKILNNACSSFNKKMCLILFTNFTDNTKEIAHNLKHGVDVPDLSFNKNELIEIFEKYNIKYKLQTLNTNTGYNIEHIFYLYKNDDEILSENNIYLIEKLENIQQNLKLDFGSFKDEYPEQLMAVRYLSGNEKVLELGGNIGRNSMIIAYILNKNGNNNFVSLECDEGIAQQLEHNKEINNLDFHIENSALSKRKLIQKGWETICSDILLDGYKNVNIITFEDLNSKYNIIFDTLVLDCEGAFYYILIDMPEILDNIKLIIMENDYNIIEHKKYIDNILFSKNFTVDYYEAGGWGPCYNNFFQVWKKQ